jgi:zinc transporter, ZIP family
MTAATTIRSPFEFELCLRALWLNKPAIAHGEESFMTDQIQPMLEGAESGWALLDVTDAVLLSLDHQAGLFQTVTGPLAELPGWLQSAGWGSLSASGLLIGAVGGYYMSLQHTTVARVMTFAAGVLLAVVAVDLVINARGAASLHWTVTGLLCGAATFSSINWLLSRRGAKHRKRCGECVEQLQEEQQPGSGLAIAAGTFLDGVPEGVVLGLSVLHHGAPGLGTVAAFFLGNIPEALSSSAGMRRAGRTARYVFGVWIGITLMISLRAHRGRRGVAVFNRRIARRRPGRTARTDRRLFCLGRKRRAEQQLTAFSNRGRERDRPADGDDPPSRQFGSDSSHQTPLLVEIIRRSNLPRRAWPPLRERPFAPRHSHFNQTAAGKLDGLRAQD